jgi:hypothetical protein
MFRHLIVVAAACLNGCLYPDPCFTPASVVSDVRVLAMTVDPAQPRVDLDNGLVEAVQLRALIADSSGSNGVFNVSWAICAAGTDAICPDDSVAERDAAWRRDSSVTLRVPLDMMRSALAADPLHGFAGVRILVTLRVSGARPSAASTPLIFALLGKPDVNHAPSIVGVRTARPGYPFGPASQSIEMFSGTPYAVRPVLDPAAIEEYDTIDFSGHPVRLRERIRYSFYATPGLAIGRLQRGPSGLVVAYGAGSDYEADEPEPGTPDPPSGLIPVTALARDGAMWIVARDSRGGTAWLEVPIKAPNEEPRCNGQAFPPLFDCVRASFGCE